MSTTTHLDNAVAEQVTGKTKDICESNDIYENKVICEISDSGVATVTLNNPDKHNAFDDTVIETLTTTFTNLANAPQVKVVVLAANGKSFSAGADLNWMKRMASYSYQENLADANALAHMLKVLNFMPKPVIGKIQGAAFGGAVGLASCCDIVVASTKASFCLSEVKLGLIPATISPYVVNAIGLSASRRYFMTAERFFANKAAELGLVDEVVEPELLDQKVDEFVTLLLANGPDAVCQAKQLAFDVAYCDLNQGISDHVLADTSARIANIRTSPEGQEGLNAFFDKRQPQWQQQVNQQKQVHQQAHDGNE